MREEVWTEGQLGRGRKICPLAHFMYQLNIFQNIRLFIYLLLKGHDVNSISKTKLSAISSISAMMTIKLQCFLPDFRKPINLQFPSPSEQPIAST